MIILGGGPSGLSVAWRLAERGVAADILELEDYAGGLSTSIRQDGYALDIGPHSFISEDDAVIEKVQGLFGDDFHFVKRSARLCLKGKYLKYPLSADDVVLKLGVATGFRCLLSYIGQRIFGKRPAVGPDDEMNVEDWARSRFGSYLYELFFHPYTEQFWKLACAEVSADAIPTSKKLSFFRTLRLLLVRPEKKENLSLTEREILASYYPLDGFGAIWEKVAAQTTTLGGNLHFGHKVVGIRRDGQRYIVTTRSQDGNTQTFEGDVVVSTIPINELPGMLTPMPPADVVDAAAKLQFLSLVVLYIATDRDPLLDCQYQYFVSKAFNRLADMNQFSPKTSPDGQNLLSVEFSCHFGDAVWNRTKEELLDLCIEDLEREGILRRDEVRDLILVKARHAYPMFRLGYGRHLACVRTYLNSIEGLRIMGRVGNFEYVDADQCLKSGFALADEIAGP